MIPATKRRRIITGCQACRDRHVRCDDEEPCRQCEQHNLECVRLVNVRFRPSTTDSLGAFPSGQKWLSPPSNVEFHDETPEVAQYYGQASWDSSVPAVTVPTYSDIRERWDRSAPSSTTASEHVSSIRHNIGILPPHSPSRETFNSQSSPARSSPRHPDRDPSLDLRPSPRQPAPSPLVIESPASLTTNSIDIDYRPRQIPSIIPFTEREAELADITDIQRHFELEVPRRAFFNLTIRYAVCAFSSRHMNRDRSDEEWAESLNYHNKCLEILIPILSNLDHELTEDVLAAVAILRLDEEMEKQDNCFHLQGITRILNQVSTFCTSGGLGEATAWLCLRQEIYISLVSQQPLRTQLPNFATSLSHTAPTDQSWANRIVLLLAQILSLAFLPPTLQHTTHLSRLSEKVDHWMSTKPPTFEPIKYVPVTRTRNLTATPTSTSTSSHRFPIIWLLQPFHVLGIQYYHIAKIVLLVSTSQSDPNKRYFFRWERTLERRVRNHILTVVGLAKSNPKAENTLFTARHTLTVWGNVLTRREDQDAVKEFLREMERKTGWETGKLIASLEGQWCDSDGNEEA